MGCCWCRGRLTRWCEVPAPRKPNTVNASAANRLRGDRTAAARLLRHGWVAIAPEVLKRLDPELVEMLRRAAGGQVGG